MTFDLIVSCFSLIKISFLWMKMFFSKTSVGESASCCENYCGIARPTTRFLRRLSFVIVETIVEWLSGDKLSMNFISWSLTLFTLLPRCMRKHKHFKWKSRATCGLLLCLWDEIIDDLMKIENKTRRGKFSAKLFNWELETQDGTDFHNIVQLNVRDTEKRLRVC